MGRELKRVPLDFLWPMNAIWKGYINPYRSVKCGACNGSGTSEKARIYERNWYGESTLLICSKPNPFQPGVLYNPKAHRYNLTQIEIDALLKEDVLKREWFTEGEVTPDKVKKLLLKAYMPIIDSSMHICLDATAEAEGWDVDCPFCKGTGEHWFSDEIEKLSDEWKRQDPPTGEGYQLWTTTNEGAPVSPVFPTLEELAKWCETGATIFGSDKLTYKGWLEWFRQGDDGYEIMPGVWAF